MNKLKKAIQELNASTDELQCTLDKFKPTLLSKVMNYMYYTFMSVLGLYIGYSLLQLSIILAERM